MRFLLASIFIAFAGPAAALSCLPPDAVGLYEQARDATEAYVPIYGQFDAGELSRLSPSTTGDYDEAADSHEDFPNLRFRGQALSSRGFDIPFDKRITLRLGCLGPWCTSLPSGRPVLAFLEVVSGGYRLYTDACGGWLYTDPMRQELEDVITCHQGRRCIVRNY